VSNGRLDQRLMRLDSRSIRDDSYAFVRVFRGRRGAEDAVAAFRARIAATNSATSGRDQQGVVGDAAAQQYVISAPLGIDIRKGDEVWTQGARYRVVAVDAAPGAQQCIAQHIQ